MLVHRLHEIHEVHAIFSSNFISSLIFKLMVCWCIDLLVHRLHEIHEVHAIFSSNFISSLIFKLMVCWCIDCTKFMKCTPISLQTSQYLVFNIIPFFSYWWCTKSMTCMTISITIFMHFSGARNARNA
jgi:hypothetical protein